MCRLCGNKELLKLFDPNIGQRILYLVRMQHHLEHGMTARELSLSLDDMDDIYYLNQDIEEIQAKRLEEELKEKPKKKAGRKSK